MPRFPKNPDAVLADEMLAEQASALGRLGRGVERALEALRAFDAAAAERATARDAGAEKAERAALVDAAAYAFWMLMVQRESIGLRDTRTLARDYAVPREVQLRVGIAKKPAEKLPGLRTRRPER